MKIIVVVALCSLVLVMACQFSENSKSKDGGRSVAMQYCGNCHQFPEPDLLDKHSWEKYILPRMGVMLGKIEHDSLRNIMVANEEERAMAEQAGYFPKTSLVTDEEWKQIKAFYLNNAPEKPKPVQQKTISKGLKNFELVIPEYKLSPPSVTMIHFNDDQTIYLGDANTQSLSVLDKDLKLMQAIKVKEGAVSVAEFPKEMFVTIMGSFSPTDLPVGFILSLPKTPEGRVYKVIDSLHRPVHSSYADLNNDGNLDIVTCEFAKWTGKLCWWQNNGNGTYTRNILRNSTGATKAYIKDMNQDGKPDVVAMFAQGDEGIFVYYNEGNGKFKEANLLHFPPSYGSTSFQLFDYNGDGKDDIIYTAGDNADFPPILKFYHGVYVFQNDGANHFTQKMFFPLNGAYAAMPFDFDKDGDIDIAAISFFPDYVNQPDESFVYLENDGKNNFKASTFSQPTLGRWIVMDVGDFEGDGDQDIVIGSLAFETTPDVGLVGKWVKEGVPFVLLKNTLVK